MCGFIRLSIFQTASTVCFRRRDGRAFLVEGRVWNAVSPGRGTFRDTLPSPVARPIGP